jgi:hypothetical protein
MPGLCFKTKNFEAQAQVVVLTSWIDIFCVWNKKKDSFIIEFKGHFYQSCGLNDYFEDFIHELEDISKEFRVELEAAEPAGQQSYIVRYRVKDKFSVADVDDEALFRDFLQDKGLSFNNYLESNSCTKDMIMFHFRTWLFEKKQISKK